MLALAPTRRSLPTGVLILCLVLAASLAERQLPAAAQVLGCQWDRGADDLPIGVYDAAGARVEHERALYVQGGIDRDGVVRDDLWRLHLDTQAVERVVTSGARATRWGHSLTWTDADGRSRLYLIGGNTSQAEGQSAESRVYAFDTGERSWRIQPMTGMPGIQAHAAAFDPTSRRIILHGGCPDNGRAGICQPQTETFVVDVGSGSVTRGQRDGPALAGHSMVYDPVGQRMLLFGGTADGRRGSDQVYQLRLAGGRPESAVWQPLDVSGSPPERRYQHGAVYDSLRRSMWVYGGLKVDGEPLGDLWALDLSTPGLALWRDVSLQNQKRSGMVMSFDARSQNTYMVSGGRPLGAEASKEIFVLACSRVDTPTPDGNGTPVIDPTPSITPGQPAVTASPSPTDELGTEVPPAVTVDPELTRTPTPSPGSSPDPNPTTGAPSATATPSPETTVPASQTPGGTALPPLPSTEAPTDPATGPATATPPDGPGRLYLPWLSQLRRVPATQAPPPTEPAATRTAGTPMPEPSAEPTQRGGPPTPLPATPSPGSRPACTSVEREPNDRLLQSLDFPPLCEADWALGSLPDGDGGDYLRFRLERAGRVSIQLADVPEGRDYDLLLYDFSGDLIGSSQLPGSLDERIELDLAAEEYAIRVYPSIGRSELTYRLRWEILQPGP